MNILITLMLLHSFYFSKGSLLFLSQENAELAKAIAAHRHMVYLKFRAPNSTSCAGFRLA